MQTHSPVPKLLSPFRIYLFFFNRDLILICLIMKRLRLVDFHPSVVSLSCFDLWFLGINMMREAHLLELFICGLKSCELRRILMFSSTLIMLFLYDVVKIVWGTSWDHHFVSWRGDWASREARNRTLVISQFLDLSAYRVRTGHLRKSLIS
jgi:hypothetical protein